MINIHALNIAPKYIKQVLTDLREIDGITIVWDSETTLREMDRAPKQKISRKHQP